MIDQDMLKEYLEALENSKGSEYERYEKKSAIFWFAMDPQTQREALEEAKTRKLIP